MKTVSQPSSLVRAVSLGTREGHARKVLSDCCALRPRHLASPNLRMVTSNAATGGKPDCYIAVTALPIVLWYFPSHKATCNLEPDWITRHRNCIGPEADRICRRGAYAPGRRTVSRSAAGNMSGAARAAMIQWWNAEPSCAQLSPSNE
jgi:hypothetical protein